MEMKRKMVPLDRAVQVLIELEKDIRQTPEDLVSCMRKAREALEFESDLFRWNRTCSKCGFYHPNGTCYDS